MPIALTPALGIRQIPVRSLHPNRFSIELYGDPETETDGLLGSITEQGILVPLVVVRAERGWEVISGHRRLACARKLGWECVPCQVRRLASEQARRQAVLEYNQQRRKMFSQMMREADALEILHGARARARQRANLRRGLECLDSDARPPAQGRTDAMIARAIGLGGKDLYRQARAVWRVAQASDPRALAALAALDSGTKTIHAAYKDLRRRDRFAAGFRPTPYDVWAFRHDRAFGVSHPGSIPPPIVAHAFHYFSSPGDLVVDPMAGGGTTLDVCASMGRKCLAYDLKPVRPEIQPHDIRQGFPAEAAGCALVFADPPYHTMLAGHWQADGAGIESAALADWLAFLAQFARNAHACLRPGGHLALLLANQTEKDLPPGFGYLDHALFGYQAMVAAGFLPVRRISCPMAGSYLPQHIQRARAEGRLLGQVRDLLVMKKPLDESAATVAASSLAWRLAAGQLVDLGPDERVAERRVPPHQGLR